MAKVAAKKTVKDTPKTKINETHAVLNLSSATDADTSVEDLFISELRDTYWAENHLVKSIPKMIASAASKGLKKALKDHLEVTVKHASRLEDVFKILGTKIVAKKCDATEGLTMSGEHVIENTVANTPTRDLGIIMSALKIENFEITAYKGLIQVAGSLGKTDVAGILQQNLDEEVAASDLLTSLSQQ